MTRRLLGGVGAAACLALIASGGSIFGIALWKIALAVAGLAIFVAGGIRDRRNPSS